MQERLVAVLRNLKKMSTEEDNPGFGLKGNLVVEGNLVV
jgi:hypothetical protein